MTDLSNFCDAIDRAELIVLNAKKALDSEKGLEKKRILQKALEDACNAENDLMMAFTYAQKISSKLYTTIPENIKFPVPKDIISRINPETGCPLNNELITTMNDTIRMIQMSAKSIIEAGNTTISNLNILRHNLVELDKYSSEFQKIDSNLLRGGSGGGSGGDCDDEIRIRNYLEKELDKQINKISRKHSWMLQEAKEQLEKLEFEESEKRKTEGGPSNT